MEGKERRELLGARVIQARKRRGWTQGQLATYAKVEQSYLSMIESGRRDNPSLDKLKAIALALKTSIDYLLGQTEDPRPLALAQSSESREMVSQIANLVVDPDMEQFFRLVLEMTPEQKASMRAFAMFLVGLHNT